MEFSNLRAGLRYVYMVSTVGAGYWEIEIV